MGQKEPSSCEHSMVPDIAYNQVKSTILNTVQDSSHSTTSSAGVDGDITRIIFLISDNHGELTNKAVV